MTRRNVGIAMMILGIIIIVITFMMTGCSFSVQTADEEKQPANTRFDASLDRTTYFSDYITVNCIDVSNACTHKRFESRSPYSA